MKNFSMMKKLVSLILTLAMLLTLGTISISAASYTPEIYSHEDGETIIAGETVTIKFDKVRGADHYYCHAKVLKSKPSNGNTNEKALSDLYDFELLYVTSNKMKIYGYDLPSDEVAGKYLKIYIEAQNENDEYISHEVMYLFIRKPFDEFVSPWEYGLLPMTTVKKGASGDHIKALRQAVNIVLGYDALKLTTKFDASLTNYLKETQGVLGVKKDGIFGKATYTAMLVYLEECGFSMENQIYSPDDAIAYALKHNMKHPGSKKNSLYPYHSGNNCSNFVAQCLVAGGLAISSDFNPYTTGFTLCRYAPKSDVSGLLEHLVSLGYPVYGLDTFTQNGSFASQPVDINKIKPGDVIFCNGSGGESGHAMLVIDINTSQNIVYFSANTNNRCGCDSCRNSIDIASITTHVAMSED